MHYNMEKTRYVREKIYRLSPPVSLYVSQLSQKVADACGWTTHGR